MANEIILSGPEFDFLLKTDLQTISDIKGFIGDIYDQSYEMIWRLEENGLNLPPLAEHIPTKLMILECAYKEFDYKYYQLLRNGHCEDTWESEFVLRTLEEFEDEVEAENEILTTFSFATGDNPIQLYEEDEDHPAILFLRDVFHGMHLFHMSYLDDGARGNCTVDEDHYSIKEWVNPPIIKVW